jgi:hypothetical protein
MISDDWLAPWRKGVVFWRVPRWARYADETPVFEELFEEQGGVYGSTSMAYLQFDPAAHPEATKWFMDREWHKMPCLPPGVYC